MVALGFCGCWCGDSRRFRSVRIAGHVGSLETVETVASLRWVGCLNIQWSEPCEPRSQDLEYRSTEKNRIQQNTKCSVNSPQQHSWSHERLKLDVAPDGITFPPRSHHFRLVDIWATASSDLAFGGYGEFRFWKSRSPSGRCSSKTMDNQGQRSTLAGPRIFWDSMVPMRRVRSSV